MTNVHDTTDGGRVLPHVLAKLNSWPKASYYWVACSGGPDSVALLDVMHCVRGQLPGPVAAVHVNHGLHPDATRWEIAVQRLCEKLEMLCHVHQVKVDKSRGFGPEGNARAARYSALMTIVEPGQMLLTAHHRDDQAETLLLHLLRGAGPSGLAGMAALGAFAAGWIGRPCLELSRTELGQYCRQRDRTWIVDPSNADVRLRRNRIRHEVLPRLDQHWSGVSQVLARAAELQREASDLLHCLGEIDLETVISADRLALELEGLRGLSQARASNVLREWIARSALPPGTRAQIRALLDMALHGRGIRTMEYRWPGTVIRHYRGRLYAGPASEEAAFEPMHWPMHWKLNDPLALPGGSLVAEQCDGQGLSVDKLSQARIEVRQRAGGERCRPIGRGLTKTVKSLLQEAGVPPWERRLQPLVYVDGELAALPGLCYCEGVAATAGEMGWMLSWIRDGVRDRRGG